MFNTDIKYGRLLYVVGHRTVTVAPMAHALSVHNTANIYAQHYRCTSLANVIAQVPTTYFVLRTAPLSTLSVPNIADSL